MKRPVSVTRAAIFIAFLAAFLMMAATRAADGFALLGFYSKDDARRWSNNYAPFLEGGLTYGFDENFFSDVPQFKSAVENALQTWTNAGTSLYFGRAPYDGVTADDDSGIMGHLISGTMEGPAPVGLGANIDFFSRPGDYEYTLWGKTRHLSGKLAMAEVIASGAEILSVDIYFNQD